MMTTAESTQAIVTADAPSRPSSAAAPRFRTKLRYTNREDKAAYVYDKYRPILDGKSILDVGADRCYLRRHLPETSRYWGVGFGEVDQEIDLETGKLPFEDNAYQSVLCLDVLEHLEHCHAVFDELCRVASEHVVISLPGPMASAWGAMRSGPYSQDTTLKFYGLPVDPPEDRHRWFFTYDEARRFVVERGRRNGMEPVEVGGKGPAPREWSRLRRWAMRVLLSPEFDTEQLFRGTLWAVLGKPAASQREAA